jgi:hypothetical protein
MIALVDMMREVVQAIDYPKPIGYLHGHRLEIANMLIEQDKHKADKYPLIALRQDFEETIVGKMHQYSLNLAILEYTDRNYTAEQRYVNVFKPILYPIYSAFFIALRKKGFYWSGWLNMPPHTKIDRPFWGVSQTNRNIEQIFTDPLDAIEIINLKINILNC